MHGICFDYELQEWFDFKIPNTKISSDYIISSLEKEKNFNTKPSAKIVWMGGKPLSETFTKSKKGNSWEMTKMTFHDKRETLEIIVEKEKGEWLIATLKNVSIYQDNKQTFAQIKDDFEKQFEDFELFWYSKPLNSLREFGLLIL
jgi:uncharacterized protein (UPF0128 family)